MTVEEKRQALRQYCKTNRCRNCPLYGKVIHCYSSASDAEINENYSSVFGDTPTECTTVNHPDHYNQGGIECIDAMVSAYGKEAVENFCLINAFKYVWRNRDKNGFEDIDKAIWYLNKVKELNSSE